LRDVGPCNAIKSNHGGAVHAIRNRRARAGSCHQRPPLDRSPSIMYQSIRRSACPVGSRLIDIPARNRGFVPVPRNATRLLPVKLGSVPWITIR